MNKISKYYKNVIAHHPHNVTHTLSLCNAKPKCIRWCERQLKFVHVTAEKNVRYV